jgi:hypothetical protein
MTDPHAEHSVNAFLWGCVCGASLASASIALGLYVGSCSLHVTPDPYTPPPLVLQGTTPDHEDAGHDH